MNTVMDNLSTVAQHASNDSSLTDVDWDGATLEITFTPSKVTAHGTYSAGGTSHEWTPSSSLLLAAAQRLRGQLPRSTRRVLVCMREGHEPWAMVHSDRGLGILPDELPTLRMNPSGA